MSSVLKSLTQCLGEHCSGNLMNFNFTCYKSRPICGLHTQGFFIDQCLSNCDVTWRHPLCARDVLWRVHPGLLQNTFGSGRREFVSFLLNCGNIKDLGLTDGCIPCLGTATTLVHRPGNSFGESRAYFGWMREIASKPVRSITFGLSKFRTQQWKFGNSWPAKLNSG